jgi:hypothetical protein
MPPDRLDYRNDSARRRGRSRSRRGRSRRSGRAGEARRDLDAVAEPGSDNAHRTRQDADVVRCEPLTDFRSEPECADRIVIERGGRRGRGIRVLALGASCALAGAGLLLAAAMLGAQTRSPLAPLPEPSAPLTPMMPPSTSLTIVRLANPVVTTRDETVVSVFSAFAATKSANRARFAEAPPAARAPRVPSLTLGIVDGPAPLSVARDIGAVSPDKDLIERDEARSRCFPWAKREEGHPPIRYLRSSWGEPASRKTRVSPEVWCARVPRVRIGGETADGHRRAR